MSKERRTVSLDPDVDDYLAQEGVNASELVNKLVKTHSTAGGNERAMLELREHQLESELEELQGRAGSKKKDLEYVREQLAEYRDERDAIIEEARDVFADAPKHPEHPGIQQWAEKAGMPVGEFIEALEQEGT